MIKILEQIISENSYDRKTSLWGINKVRIISKRFTIEMLQCVKEDAKGRFPKGDHERVNAFFDKYINELLK